MGSQRLTRALATASLLIAASLVALGLGEGLVRWLAPQPQPLTIALRGLHAPDPELGYTMVPRFARQIRTASFACDVRTNSLGLREREIAPPTPHRLRLVGIGDSFVLGIHAGPPDSCFIERLGEELDGALAEHPITTPDGRKWSGAEAINAGVDGYGTAQEVALLERLAPTLHPDAVVLAFYLGNDFTDNSGRTRMTVVDGYQMLQASEPGYRAHFRPLQRRVRLWLHVHSELYAFLKERLLQPLGRHLGPAETVPPGGSRSAPKPIDDFIYDAGFEECLRTPLSPQMEKAMAATRAALLELRRWSDAEHVPALVVALPAEQQVDSAARRRWLERFGLDASTHDFGLPNRRLLALASDAGLPCFDLTPGFAARAAGGADLYLHGDAHWNAAGHALAARSLLEPVLEDLLRGPPRLIGAR